MVGLTLQTHGVEKKFSLRQAKKISGAFSAFCSHICAKIFVTLATCHFHLSLSDR